MSNQFKIFLAVCTYAITGTLVYAASSGTITFTGSVNSETCAAVVNNGSADGTVSLPAVPTSALSAAGATAGATAFTINLTGCDPANTKTRAFFEAGGQVNSAGRLNNSDTAGATNVELELLDVDDNSSVIMAGDYASQSTSGTTIDASSTTGTLNYAVRYYATGAATSGAVASSVTYSIIYL
ncbi:fimbrial protein [Enterobacter cloacae]|jgi:major type 1 subunit fimbrin (pilin)|uniref:fimbrial protein n=1 Tax=Enterobacter cloacae TaxID=550 RepID=UPI001C93D272|nr:fimbrial protein [Enterobacter cloacae]MBY5116623.1 type 1 fimbrial protein [Enterobacter cloacae]HBL7051961.1 type 1 fimbrial protein [Enterobacter cloacae]